MSSIDEARTAARNFGAVHPELTAGITRIAPGDFAVAARAETQISDLPATFEGVPVSFATFTELRHQRQGNPPGRS